MKRGAFVLLVAGDGGESLNRGEFHQGIVNYGRDKRWVIRREGDVSQMDGVIVYGVDESAEGKLRVALEGVPVVWGQRISRGSGLQVIADEWEIGRIGARHFAEAGFRKLGFLLGKMESSLERWKGFCEAASELGLEEPVALALPDFGEGGVEAVREFGSRLGEFGEPVGVMAPTDRVGVDVLYAAGAAGLRVPEQVAVLGVGNDAVECAVGPVGLSSVEVNARRQGAVAAEALDRMMDGGEIGDGEILIRPGEVEVRRSSDVQAVPHLKAAMALQFIRRNYGESGLSVDRVAEAVGMSRRGLEDAFRNHVSQGIGKAITEMRIRFAKEMLAGTRRNVSEVAVKVGFRNSQYFHRCFSKMVGMTPARYRREMFEERREGNR